MSLERFKSGWRESRVWLDVRLLTFSSLDYSLPRLWRRRKKLGFQIDLLTYVVRRQGMSGRRRARLVAGLLAALSMPWRCLDPRPPWRRGGGGCSPP